MAHVRVQKGVLFTEHFALYFKISRVERDTFKEPKFIRKPRQMINFQWFYKGISIFSIINLKILKKIRSKNVSSSNPITVNWLNGIR